jgi:energy-coupling factor transporter ATP-binding protein EcfA2
MKMLQAISEWVEKKPGWYSDAVRRVFQQSTLTTDDEEAVLRNLYIAYGLISPQDEEPEVHPWGRFTENSSDTAPKILLKEIHDVQHVNALVPGQSLKFALNGLTVVYGENGAGKSGYARILKHACFARDKGAPIKPNVQIASDHRPEAIIEYLRDGHDEAFRWRGNSPSLEVLANVAVFDSHSARAVLDDANEVVYLPYGMDTFPRLVTLFERLKNHIQQQLNALDGTYINVHRYDPATKAGQLISELSHTTPMDQIRALATLSPVEQNRLNELQQLLIQARLVGVDNRVQQLKNRKQRVEQLITTIEIIRHAVSPDRIEAIIALAKRHEAARNAADLAAQPAFHAEPLSGAGSDAWRALFEAARKFSETQAYPDRSFPVIDDGALCVLCQQPLDTTACDRLKRFDEFVKDSVTHDRDEAATQLQQALEALSRLPLNTLANDDALLDELRVSCPQAAALVEQLFNEARQITQELLAATSSRNGLESRRELSNPMSLLDTLVHNLAGEIANLQQAAQPDSRVQIEQELKELQDRLQLHADLGVIETCIRVKSREFGLRKCQSALVTDDITRLNSRLMEQLVTDELKTNLAAELSRFDLPCPAVNVKRLGQKGKAKHQMVIAAGEKPSAILSEGEQRLIAIASFLAELRTAKSESPIIFDDPVSSLDHRYRERVAERLVAESKVRQVIILTHDIVLFLKLHDEAARQQVPILIQTIKRLPNGPGNCMPANELPWPACKTKSRIGTLKNHIVGIRKIQKESPDVYCKDVGVFYGLLRETWERAIEEVLLNDVVQRYKPGIETMRLKQVSVETGDYLAIERGMSKCSTYLTGHDEAAARSLQSPSPDEMENDLKELEEFSKRINDRAKQTQDDNARLAKAPAVEVAQSRAPSFLEPPEATAIRSTGLC